MSILATLLATWTIGLSPVASLQAPAPEVAVDPAIVAACVDGGGTEADCTQQAIASAKLQA